MFHLPSKSPTISGRTLHVRLS